MKQVLVPIGFFAMFARFLCVFVFLAASIPALRAEASANHLTTQAVRSESDFGESASEGLPTTRTLAASESELSEAEQFLAAQSQISDVSESPRAGTGLLLLIYCVGIMIASIGGGWLPTLIDLTHTRMQTTISFVGGLMLGIAVFHLLPHSIRGRQSADDSAWWMMAGIVTMFLLIRCFHFHHHGPLEISTAEEDPCASHRDHDHNHDDHDDAKTHDRKQVHDHDHDGEHDHEHEHNHELSRQPVASRLLTQPHCHHAHKLSWLGIALGLSLHTLLDGMALAASVQAESIHRPHVVFFGLGTFLAIMLHKPLDAVSITSLMAGAGWSSRSRFLVSLGFSAMCPMGVILFRFAFDSFGSFQEEVICSAMAFSAGVFLCISLSDLLPEMEFHAHNRVRLTAVLLAGILLAYGITFLE